MFLFNKAIKKKTQVCNITLNNQSKLNFNVIL